jgi:hypothetical protein
VGNGLGQLLSTFEEGYIPEFDLVGATSKRVHVESPTVESLVSLSELTKMNSQHVTAS